MAMPTSSPPCRWSVTYPPPARLKAVLFDVDESGDLDFPEQESLSSKQIAALEDEGEVPESGDITESEKPWKEALEPRDELARDLL